MATPSLRVQTVLYGNDEAQVARFTRALRAAGLVALDAGLVSAVSLVVGDCSEEPAIGDPCGLPWDPSRLGPVHYEHFGANLGSAGGHNALFASLTDGPPPTDDLVVVTNADTCASPGLLAELVAAFDDASVGVVEARQVPLEQPKVHDPVTGDTSWASGACFAARAEVIAETGGFDPDYFFLYADDVDFSWRAKLAGWRVVHRPSAAVFHDKRLTPGGDLQASDLEISLGAEAGALLAWRYSRPDLAELMIGALGAAGDERLRASAARLADRLRSGKLPEPLDPGHEVAQFVGPDYAVHRFSWGA